MNTNLAIIDSSILEVSAADELIVLGCAVTLSFVRMEAVCLAVWQVADRHFPKA